MTILYAQADAAWASANWNTQADGGGSAQAPVDGDTCEANNHAVAIGTNLPIGVTLKCTAGGQFTLSALNLSLYTLISGVVAPEYVIAGHDNYSGGSAGTYHEATVSEVKDGVMFGAASALEGEYSPGGTYAEGEAAQLATDTAAVEAAKAGIRTTVTLCGVTGTLNLSLYTLISGVVAPQYVIAGHDNYTGGSAGTYHEATTAEVKSGVTFGAASALTGTYSPGGTYAEGQAAQLATDAAAITAARAEIPSTDTLVGVAGTLDLATPALHDIDGNTIVSLGPIR